MSHNLRQSYVLHFGFKFAAVRPGHSQYFSDCSGPDRSSFAIPDLRPAGLD